ncbi:MAG: peptide deformylase [Thermodesulfobacteriota bacterium]
MRILEIATYPDEFLKKISKPVESINGSIQELIENMATTMYHAPGVGLAATQVRSDQRILVYDLDFREGREDLQVLINPRIIEGEGEFLSEDEGCLSVPDFRADVKRFSRILIEGVDRHGTPRRFEAEGFLATVLQHEIDHLNGKLFIDRISALKRELYKRRVRKQIKNQ